MQWMSGIKKQLSVVFIAVALALLLAIAPDRGTFPSTADLIALHTARDAGDDLTEWRWLARFVSAHPHNASIWEHMAVLDYRNGLCQQANIEFNMAASYGKLSPETLLFYAECLLDQGKYGEVVNLLSPHLGDAYKPYGLERLLARAYLNQNDHAGALLILMDWAVPDGKDPLASYTLGLYQALTDPSESLKNLQSAASQDPEYSETYREIQTAVNTAQLSDNFAYQAVVVGQAYGNLNEWELAEYAFQTAVKVDPDYAEAHAWLGEARQHLGADGSNELQLALELNPDSILAQALNALYLQRQGRPDEALIYLNQVAEAEPANPAWQMALGQSNAQLGKLVEANGYYQHAVELEPENVTTWQALAEFCLTYQFEVQTAGIVAANKAVLLSPDSPRSLDLAGQAALIGGNLISAEYYLRKAITLDPRFAPAHLHLALVLLQQDKNQEARQELEKATTLGNLEAEHMLSQLTSP